MTKHEREQLRKAIRLLHDDDEYWEAMNILARLAGWPEFHLDTESVAVYELLEEVQKNPQDFKAPELPDDLKDVI